MKAKPSGSATTKKPEEPKEVKSKTQTIELNIKLCCGNCVQNVRKALDDVKGAEKVGCEQDLNKVYVTCTVQPEII
ncbi:heavy metal-associated isoprenylated plant protein 44-like isoform X2 [Physcomitrium patens]|uniref:heavy metal-associated isoprenylated plant protein 44-like isoform X2 n=1 Tax=Physcomitrium patens TaxID=3218 RepID=UPI003CCE1C4E